MQLLDAFTLAVKAGTPVAFIAKNINRDPTTLSKWYHGKSKISEDVQIELKQELLRLQSLWKQIEL